MHPLAVTVLHQINYIQVRHASQETELEQHLKLVAGALRTSGTGTGGSSSSSGGSSSSGSTGGGVGKPSPTDALPSAQAALDPEWDKDQELLEASLTQPNPLASLRAKAFQEQCKKQVS